jgi:hypothetical protein
VTEHRLLIQTKLLHLARMREYLAYSLDQVEKLLPLNDWPALTPDQHESLAAFRVRFSEFQEHLGKTIRAVAIEEEQDAERFGAVLAFMERLHVLDTAEHWKLIRELRNAVNHEYEDETARLAEFFALLAKETPALFGYFARLRDFCAGTYGAGDN